MKKKISLLLVLLLILQTVAGLTLYAEEENTAELESVSEQAVEYTVAEKLLFALGIADKNDYQTKGAIEKNITRAEFIKFIALILNVDTSKTYTENRYFKDVPMTHKYASVINAMVESGFVKGVDEYNFCPDDFIKPEHAATLLLKAAGYTNVEAIGLTYSELIAQNKLVTGINKAQMNFNDASNMIYKALKMPKCTYRGTKYDAAAYELYDEITLLSDNYETYELSGTITSSGVFSIYNDKNAGNGSIMIDDIKLKTDIDAYNDIGCHVKAFYKQGQNDDEKTLIMYDKDSKNDELIITADDVISFKDGIELKYYDENEKIKTESIPLNAIVIKNGEIVTRDLLNSTAFDNGLVRLAADENGDYRYVFITAYDHIFVSKADPAEKIIYAKYGKTLDYSSPSIKRINVFDDKNVPMDISAIKAGMLLTVARSSKSVDIYVSTNTVIGKITKVEDDKISIGNVEYDVSEDCNNKAYLKTGFEGSFFIGYEGKINYVNNITDTKLYGYLRYVNVKQLNNGSELRIFKTTGEFETYKTTAKVLVDNNKLDSEGVFNYFKNASGEFVSQFVGYTVNKDGLVTAIDTVKLGENESKYSLTDYSKDGYANRFYGAYCGFSGKFIPTSKTVILFIPNDTNAEDNEFSKMTSLTDESTYNCAAFATDPTSFSPDFIIIKGKEKTYGFSTYGHIWVVDTVNRVYNVQTGKEEINIVAGGSFNAFVTGTSGVKTIKVYEDFKLTDSAIAEGCCSYTDIDTGDIIEIATDNDNEIRKIRKLFDYSDPNSKLEPRNKNDMFSYNGRYYMCYPNIREGNIVKIGYDSPKNIDEIIQVRADDYCKTVVFDSSKKENRVYEGTWEDMITYEETGDENSVSAVISLTYKNGNPFQTIIYKYGIKDRTLR